MKKTDGHFSASTVFRHALLFSVLFVVLQLMILFITTQYSDNMRIRQEKLHTQNILNLCIERINESTKSADNTLKFILSQDTNLKLLNSQKENTAYHIWYTLSGNLNLSLFADDWEKSYVISDKSGKVLLERRGNNFTYNDMKHCRHIW